VEDHRVLFSVLHALAGRPFALIVLRGRGKASKNVELVLLRHEISVLRRQTPRARLEPADRLIMAALARHLPGPYGRRPRLPGGCWPASTLEDGRYIWEGGLGTAWSNDASEDLIVVVLTQRTANETGMPAVCAKVLSAARASGSAQLETIRFPPQNCNRRGDKPTLDDMRVRVGTLSVRRRRGCGYLLVAA
jgi:hypothetical protein